MKQNEKIRAKHKLGSEVKEFDLVATEVGRKSKGEASKYYPFFPDSDQNFAKVVEIFGEETVAELAFDQLRTKFQQLYFVRSPSGEQIPVLKDGKPATIKNDKGEDIPITQADETPRIEQFLVYIEDENLSSREITAEYCMRKATNIMAKVDKKWADRSDMERMMEAAKWIAKAQEMISSQLVK